MDPEEPLISRRHAGTDPRDVVVTLEEIAGSEAPRGHATLRVEPAAAGPPAAWLLRLAVREGDRGRGLGRRLLREAADEARRAGAADLRADLAGAPAGAAAWLGAAGFRLDGGTAVLPL